MKPRQKYYFYASIILISLLQVFNIDILFFPWLKALFAGCAFLLIPGDLIYSLVFQKDQTDDYLERLPLIFCCGLVFLNILGLCAYLTQIDWVKFQFLILFAAIFLCLIVSPCSYRIHQVQPVVPDKSGNYMATQFLRKSRTDYLAYGLLISMLLMVTLISFSKSGAVAFKPDRQYLTQQIPTVAVGLRTSDRFIHWFYLKRLAESRQIINQCSSLHYSYNTWYLFIVSLAKFAGINYRWAWSFLIILGTPLLTAAVYTLGKALFNNTRWALSCAFLYLINGSLFNTYFSDAGLWNWIGSPNPREIGFILMTVVFAMWLKYLRENKTKYWVAIIMFSLSTLLIHEMDFAFILIFLGFFALVTVVFPLEHKQTLLKILKTAVFLFVLALPLIYLKSPTKIGLVKAETANPELAATALLAPSGSAEQEIKLLGVEASKLGILPTPSIFLSLCLITLLFPFLGANYSSAFLVAGTILPPLLAYNPLIPFTVSKILAGFNINVPIETLALVTGLRTACLFPAIFVCVFGFYRIMEKIKSQAIILVIIICGGVLLAMTAISQFFPGHVLSITRYIKAIRWPFYPPWAMFLLVILNFVLFLRAGFKKNLAVFSIRDPKRHCEAALPPKQSHPHAWRLLRSARNDTSGSPYCYATKNLPKPWGKTINSGNNLAHLVGLGVIAFILTLPVEIKFFNQPERYQSLEQLADGSPAYRFVEQRIPLQYNVLADPINSFYLAAYSGHSAHSFYVTRKKNHPLLRVFQPNMTNAERLSILKNQGMAYIYLDKRVVDIKLLREIALLPQYYQRIYQDDFVEIYRIA
ncbi:MAG: hypothetical protein HZA78_10935 [Candidatus Schekmanbacteria bacterium]|nr:hypothetical protein [Candidatus Schekmanbacteria bacterium]